MELRDYQREAIDRTYEYATHKAGNPCIVIPTGSGKSPVCAMLCKETVEAGGTVIVLTHVKELIVQLVDHLLRVDPMLPVGVYSAGLYSKDASQAITVAGIQSAFRNPDDFTPPSLIIVDEAHRIPVEGEGMYRTFLAAMKLKNPDVRLVGLTATPYRTGSGLICTPENLLNEVSYEAEIKPLVERGFLAPLVYRGPQKKIDFSGVHVRAGEFVSEEVEKIMEEDQVTVDALINLMAETYETRKSILIFASSVRHGNHIATLIRQNNEVSDIYDGVAEVYGDTEDHVREKSIKDFKEGRIKYLINRDVLTTGFDAPNVDCVAILRPTMSEALYAQMIGRGMRVCPGKTDCLVMDFGGNVERHGFIENLSKRVTKGTKPGETAPEEEGNGGAPSKQCDGCQLIVHCAVKVCPACDRMFPVKITRKSFEEIKEGVPRNLTVIDVAYDRHIKFLQPDKPPTFKVFYKVEEEAVSIVEWVCLEHPPGFARDKAIQWWARHGGLSPAPSTVEEGLDRIGELKNPSAIRVTRREKYDRIEGLKFEAKVPF